MSNGNVYTNPSMPGHEHVGSVQDGFHKYPSRAFNIYNDGKRVHMHGKQALFITEFGKSIHFEVVELKINVNIFRKDGSAPGGGYTLQVVHEPVTICEWYRPKNL